MSLRKKLDALRERLSDALSPKGQVFTNTPLPEPPAEHGPSREHLAFLRSQVGNLKNAVGQAHLKRQAKKKGNGSMLMPDLCPICSKEYDTYNGLKAKRERCPVCQKMFDDGYCAVVSVDGRHAFIKSADGVAAKWGAGKVLAANKEQMDKIHAGKNPTPTP